MAIVTDEIFGPVQSIMKFKDLNEVIKRENASHYGLAAGVFTKSIETTNTLTCALRVGTVWVNCFDIFYAGIPFGGYKISGTGREKGIYSIQNYLQVKAVISPLKLFSLQAHVILYITNSLLNLETHTMFLEVELA